MKGDIFRVVCPYCGPVGSALVDVTYRNGAHIADTKPRQCESCKRYFDIQVKLHLSGVPLGPVDRNTSVRKALRTLAGA